MSIIPPADSFSQNFVPPKGADKPKIYIVGEAPGPEEDEQRKPFVGRAGHLLHMMLAAAEVPEDIVRFFNCIPYRPIMFNNSGQIRNRPLTPEEIEQYKVFVENDIRKSKPEMIIAVGKSAMAVFGIDSSVTKARFQKYEWEGIPVRVTYHPMYVGYNGGQGSNAWDDVVSDLRKFHHGDDNDFTKGVTVETHMIDAFDLDQLKTLDELFPDEDLVLDYETSGLDVFRQGFHVGGAVISDLRADVCRYIYINDFWRPYKDHKLPEANLKFIREWFRRKNFVVFNCQYECPVTLVWLQEELNLKDDPLMLLRCLGKGSSLKMAAQRRLGATQWSDDIADYIRITGDFIKNFKINSDGKNDKPEIKWAKEQIEKGEAIVGGIFDLRKAIILRCEFEASKKFKSAYKEAMAKKATEEIFEYQGQEISPKDFLDRYSQAVSYVEEFGLRNAQVPRHMLNMSVTECLEAFTNKREKEVLRALDELRTIASRYFKGPRFIEFASKYLEYIMHRLEIQDYDGHMAYTDIPVEIILPYGINDGCWTALLYKDVLKELDERGIPEAGRYYVDQALLGYELEKNGIAWDDNKAEELKQGYIDTATESLRTLLSFPRMQKILEFKDQDILTVQSTTDLEVLKNYFNPASSYAYPKNPELSTKVRFSKLMCTPRFKMGMMFHNLHERSHEFKTDEELINCYPVLGPIYIDLMKLESSHDRAAMLDDLAENYADIDTKMIEQYSSSLGSGSDLPEEIKMFQKYGQYTLESTDALTMETLYAMFEIILAVDVDDQDSWVEEFKYMYWFRLHKKVLKSLGSYINGKMGRTTVEIIDREVSQSKIPIRVAHYRDRPLKKNEIYLSKSEFKVCTAATKRWQSFVHTVPWNCELMDLRCSRFGDQGVRIHFDYSQNEIRMLAALSGDKNLLDAFYANKDVHLFVASKVWNKPEEQVEAAERRFAKMASFSIIYGKSIPAFAREFMHGDVQGASDLFNGFYSQFPDVKAWIDQKHVEAFATGEVSSIFGDPILVDMPYWALELEEEVKQILIENVYSRDVTLDDDFHRDRKMRGEIAKAMRNSQNYPCQHAGSNIAGLSINRVREHIIREGLRAKMDCFTHDSSDIDSPVHEIHKILGSLRSCAVDWPRAHFDIPVEIDYEIGTKGNQMIALEDTKVEGSRITTGFKGKKHALDALVERLRSNGVDVDYEVKDESEEFVSNKELFISRRAYSIDIGRPYTNVKGEMQIDSTKVAREAA